MTLVLGLLLVAGVALYVGGPILRPPAARGGQEPPAADARREILMRQLGELEYDYRMGKVDGDDYRRQRAGLMHRL